MSNVARVAGQAANTLSKPLNVEEVFSTYLYEGTGSAQTITNGIDLAGEGGMVWIKNRSDAIDSAILDTVFSPQYGNYYRLETNKTDNQANSTSFFNGFTSSGFTVNGTSGQFNESTKKYASWTFRKAPKFFDVVTYTGTGSAQTIAHNLGTTVGSIFVKRTDATSDWNVYHRESHNFPANNFLRLNLTNAVDADFDIWNATVPTDAVFSVGSSTKTNASGGSYVAYLFAHNDGDGEFGGEADADIIKCGSFTSDGSSDYDIDLGFEPQLLILKRATGGTANWFIQDNIREFSTDRSDILFPNLSNAEGNYVANYIPLSTGFGVRNGVPSGDHIYIAIRRGPMAVPESASEVFAMDVGDGLSTTGFQAGFPIDFALERSPSTVTAPRVGARLMQGKVLFTDRTNGETVDNNSYFDSNTEWYVDNRDSTYQSWMWKRAPSFFDVVAYTGNGANRTINHNLGVAPEMMWVKRRDTADDWAVYYGDPTDYLELNTTAATDDNSYFWNDTAPTETVFSLGANVGVNGSGSTYIAYLFASLDGVSKVGSYTGNGSSDGDSQNIDCGFSSGARFVLIKRTDAVNHWFVYDTERGIVAGNEGFLLLNGTQAENTTYDNIDPYSAGFTINQSANNLNLSGATYIFYAIA